MALLQFVGTLILWSVTGFRGNLIEKIQSKSKLLPTVLGSVAFILFFYWIH
jgi:hypothetical protein